MRRSRAQREQLSRLHAGAFPIGSTGVDATGGVPFGPAPVSAAELGLPLFALPPAAPSPLQAVAGAWPAVGTPHAVAHGGGGGGGSGAVHAFAHAASDSDDSGAVAGAGDLDDHYAADVLSGMIGASASTSRRWKRSRLDGDEDDNEAEAPQRKVRRKIRRPQGASDPDDADEGFCGDDESDSSGNTHALRGSADLDDDYHPGQRRPPPPSARGSSRFRSVRRTTSMPALSGVRVESTGVVSAATRALSSSTAAAFMIPPGSHKPKTIVAVDAVSRTGGGTMSLEFPVLNDTRGPGPAAADERSRFIEEIIKQRRDMLALVAAELQAAVVKFKFSPAQAQAFRRLLAVSNFATLAAAQPELQAEDVRRRVVELGGAMFGPLSDRSLRRWVSKVKNGRSILPRSPLRSAAKLAADPTIKEVVKEVMGAAFTQKQLDGVMNGTVTEIPPRSADDASRLQATVKHVQAFLFHNPRAKAACQRLRRVVSTPAGAVGAGGAAESSDAGSGSEGTASDSDASEEQGSDDHYAAEEHFSIRKPTVTERKAVALLRGTGMELQVPLPLGLEAAAGAAAAAGAGVDLPAPSVTTTAVPPLPKWMLAPTVPMYSLSTIHRLVGELGYFYQVGASKGLLSSHERKDVVEQRRVYVNRMAQFASRRVIVSGPEVYQILTSGKKGEAFTAEEYRKLALDPTNVHNLGPDGKLRDVVLVSFHDECTLRSSASGQPGNWLSKTEETKGNPPRARGGQLLMLQAVVNQFGCARLQALAVHSGHYNNSQLSVTEYSAFCKVLVERMPRVQHVIVVDRSRLHLVPSKTAHDISRHPPRKLGRNSCTIPPLKPGVDLGCMTTFDVEGMEPIKLTNDVGRPISLLQLVPLLVARAGVGIDLSALHEWSDAALKEAALRYGPEFSSPVTTYDDASNAFKVVTLVSPVGHCDTQMLVESFWGACKQGAAKHLTSLRQGPALCRMVTAVQSAVSRMPASFFEATNRRVLQLLQLYHFRFDYATASAFLGQLTGRRLTVGARSAHVIARLEHVKPGFTSGGKLLMYSDVHPSILLQVAKDLNLDLDTVLGDPVDAHNPVCHFCSKGDNATLQSTFGCPRCNLRFHSYCHSLHDCSFVVPGHEPLCPGCLALVHDTIISTADGIDALRAAVKAERDDAMGSVTSDQVWDLLTCWLGVDGRARAAVHRKAEAWNQLVATMPIPAVRAVRAALEGSTLIHPAMAGRWGTDWSPAGRVTPPAAGDGAVVAVVGAPEGGGGAGGGVAVDGGASDMAGSHAGGPVPAAVDEDLAQLLELLGHAV